MSGRENVKLLTSEGRQVLDLPAAFRFDGDEITIRRDGAAVILEPVVPARRRTPEEMAAFWRRLDALRGDELLVRAPPPEFPPEAASLTVEDVDAMFAQMDALGDSDLEEPPEPKQQVRDLDW